MRKNDPYNDNNQKDIISDQQAFITILRRDQLGKDPLVGQSTDKWPIELFLQLILQRYDEQQPVPQGITKSYIDVKNKFELNASNEKYALINNKKIISNAFFIHYAALSEGIKESIIDSMIIAAAKNDIIYSTSSITYPLCDLIILIKNNCSEKLLLKISLLENLLRNAFRTVVKEIKQLIQTDENISFIFTLVSAFERKEVIIAKQCYRAILNKIGIFASKDETISRDKIEEQFLQLLQLQVNDIKDTLFRDNSKYGLYINLIKEIENDKSFLHKERVKLLNNLLTCIPQKKELTRMAQKSDSHLEENKNGFRLKKYFFPSPFSFLTSFKSKQPVIRSMNILVFDPDGALVKLIDEFRARNQKSKFNFENTTSTFDQLKRKEIRYDALIVAIDFYHNQSSLDNQAKQILQFYSSPKEFLVFLKKCDINNKEEKLLVEKIQTIFPNAISHFTKQLSMDFLDFVISQTDVLPNQYPSTDTDIARLSV